VTVRANIVAVTEAKVGRCLSKSRKCEGCELFWPARPCLLEKVACSNKANAGNKPCNDDTVARTLWAALERITLKG